MRFEQNVVQTRSLVWHLLLAVGLAGCDGVEPVATATPANDAAFYARLAMNYRVATISTVPPYDTVQLRAVPVDLAGNALADLPAPIFFSPDTAAVFVTPEGLVRARKTGTNVRVIARLDLAGNLAHADTALIDITDLASPPRMKRIVADEVFRDLLTFSLVSGDSLVMGQQVVPSYGADIASEFAPSLDWMPYDYPLVFYSPTLGRSYLSPFHDVRTVPVIRMYDSTDQVMSGLHVEVRTLDPEIVGVVEAKGVRYTLGRRSENGLPGVPLKPGMGRMEVRTSAYGITMADTVTWKITPPPFAMIHFIPEFDGTLDFTPNKIRIRTHGGVVWWNWSTDTTQVIFDDPTNVAMPSDEICQVFVNRQAYDFAVSDGPHCGAGNVTLPARVGPFPDFVDGLPTYLNDPSTPYAPYLSLQALWHEQVRQFPVAGTYRFRDPRTGKTGEIIVSDGPDE